MKARAAGHLTCPLAFVPAQPVSVHQARTTHSKTHPVRLLVPLALPKIEWGSAAGQSHVTVICQYQQCSW